MREKISKPQFNSAKRTIKNYEMQINEKRIKLFRDSLKEFDETFWLYIRPMQRIYMSAKVKDRGIFVVRYIINSNSLLEIKTCHFDRSSMKNYLKTLSEFEHDEIFDKDDKYLFEKITKKTFKLSVNNTMLNKMGLKLD